MDIRRKDSLGFTLQLFKIKDLHFFRHLLCRYDLSIVKDFLHCFLEVVTFDPYCISSIDSQHYVYIASQDFSADIPQTDERINFRQGHTIYETVTKLVTSEQYYCYRLSKKIIHILEKLYFLQLSILKKMKSSQKFWFFQKCDVIGLDFNSFVYRKGEDVEAVYYVIQGQIKMVKQLGSKIFEVASLEAGRMFGLFQIKSGCKKRELYAKSGLNNTQVLKIPFKTLQYYSNEQQTSVEGFLSQEKSELYSLTKKGYFQKRQFALRELSEPNLTQRVILERNLKIFQMDRMIKSEVIQNLVQSKKLIYKVKQLNDKMHSSMNRSGMLEVQNAYAVKHYNDKWRHAKQKQRIDRHKNKKISNQNSKTTNFWRTSLKGLLKYPSVKRYFGIKDESRQDEYF